MKKISPKITLVGAGPGDPDLLTLKGLKALRAAKVVVYDALVDERLLLEAPHAVHVFAGKRLGYKKFSQTDINQLLVNHALVHGSVVRLKGGDSFVFGRGWEELEFARKHGVSVEVIPGLSSAISVPALANIPVSHRDLTRSFYVVTGTLSNGAFNTEIEQAAQLNTTLVILMGLNQLEHIVTAFTKAGKSETAIAIISNGSLSAQNKVQGRIDSILGILEATNIESPALIVVGVVVDLENDLLASQWKKAQLN